MTEAVALTHARLIALLRYHPESGVFIWLQNRGQRVKAGDVAGSLNSSGYWVIGIAGRDYLAQRLAVFFMTGLWPSKLVDHKDTDTLNNRWRNLRDVSNTVNLQNQRTARSDNKCGVLGVHQTKTGRFESRIVVGGARRYLGAFSTKDAAHAAYVAAKRLLHEGNTL